MAELTRRIWSVLSTEALNGLGGVRYTAFAARVNQWMNEAYLDLCLTYHHQELETSTTVTLPVDANSVPLPADLFLVVGVQLLDANGQMLGYLAPKRFQAVVGMFQTTVKGQPSTYARAGMDLYFDRNAKAQYQLKILYYRYPTPPDFASTTATPEIGWLWDGHLIEATVAKGQNRTWRPDLSQFDAQTLQQWLAEQVQPSLSLDPATSMSDTPNTNRPIGGAQG